MNILNNFWQDIRDRENLDVYITVIIAIVVAIGGIFGLHDTIIFSAILATLAMVSLGLLQNRRENREIRLALKQVNTSDQLSDKFLKDEFNAYELRERLAQARQIIIWSATFADTMATLSYAIEEALKADAKVRFLVMKPDSAAANVASLRHRFSREPLLESAKIKNVLSRLAKLSSSVNSGQIEARVVDYIPPYTIVGIDINHRKGYMWLRLASPFTDGTRRPTFGLDAIDDKKWFGFFSEQFETMWKVSEVIDLSEYSNNPV